MRELAGTVCPTCGGAVDVNDLHVRFKLPDPVLTVPVEERAARIRGGDIITVDEIGAFARVLLPITLTGGGRITFGTWLGFLDRDEYERARDCWEDPVAYPALRFRGVIANEIAPWPRLFCAPVVAAVHNTDEIPYVEEICDLAVGDVLSETWPRGQVLDALPARLWHGCEVEQGAGA